MKKTLILCALLVLFAIPSFADGTPEAFSSLDLGSLRVKADAGDVGAQHALALRYAAAQDFSEAAKWFRKAAKQDDVGAEAGLANLYYLGQGVPQDDRAAAMWYLKAADHGDKDSQFFLGRLYLKGRGVNQDYAEAYFWYSLSGENPQGSERGLNIALTHLSAEQKATADALLGSWKPSPAAAAAADPCAANEDNPADYLVCKDRMHKLRRMEHAAEQRDNEYQP